MDAPLAIASPPREPQRQEVVIPRQNSLHLRGLPYDVEVETIIKFLGEHTFGVVGQGVHMVYDVFGQPSGEAFIRMDSEEAAYWAATHCHGRRIEDKGRPRCIEVLQCSMNDVQDPGAGPGPLPPASPGDPGAVLAPVLPLADASSLPPMASPSALLYPGLPLAPLTHILDMGVVMVLLRGLPHASPVPYIMELFEGFPELTPDNVNVQLGADGNPNGKATVIFPRQVDAGRVVEELRRRNIGIDLLVVA